MHWAGRALRRAGTEILRRSGIEGTWIDVGAYHGDKTLWNARHNPGLRIYAFEPNLRAAAKLIGVASNYIVIPMAVAEKDGVSELYLNSHEPASSLLPFDDAGLRSWVGEQLKIDRVISVPTVRLDTFMSLMDIGRVDFLKIDAQGMDLNVLRSAGPRLRDIMKITLEVGVTPIPLYVGASSKADVLALLEGNGFALEQVETQSRGQEENLTFLRTR